MRIIIVLAVIATAALGIRLIRLFLDPPIDWLLALASFCFVLICETVLVMALLSLQ